MHLQDDPRASRYADRAVGGEHDGRSAGDPAADEPSCDSEPAEARVDPVFVGQRRALARVVHTHEDVVGDLEVVRQDLQRLEPLLLRQSGVDRQADELVFDLAERRRRVLAARMRRGIGVGEVERWRSREGSSGRRIAGRATGARPGGDQVLLLGIQTRVVQEAPRVRTVVGLFGMEGRHVPRLDLPRDRGRPRLRRIRVGEQDVGVHAVRGVARQAVLSQDRGDVLMVGDVVPDLGLRAGGQDREENQSDRQNAHGHLSEAQPSDTAPAREGNKIPKNRGDLKRVR